MVVADLHVHTRNSDGTLTLGALPDAAATAGLDAVAVTDHDRLHPDLDAPVVNVDGLTVVHGIELRVAPVADGHAGERVDLLAYGARRTDALEGVVERVQENRVERGRAIVQNVEDHLGVDLGVTVERGFGRPNVARAVDEHPDTALDYEGAFDELIGDDGPCYVRREVPSFEEGLAVLDGACPVVGLAHPLRYGDVEAALELTADLDAIERHYPYGWAPAHAPVERVIDEHDLLVTGGTDAHGTELGLAGLARAEFRRFRDALELDG
jgi:predicted metal-dependent phosphoesterase TrpH